MRPEPSGSKFLVPGSIVLAGITIAAAVIYVGEFGRAGRGASDGVASRASGGGSAAVGAALGDLASDDPALGNPSAPVTIVEFGDFQCPFCGRFFADTEQKIIDAYVKTGQARFVYRDFPITAIHEHAQKAAEAAECANEQGKFWPYHDRLYQRQSELGIENYKRWAVELGLDAGRFNACLDSGKYAGEVQSDFRDGQSAGVSGTPTTFVNGRLISGALPFEQFKSAIEEALATSGKR